MKHLLKFIYLAAFLVSAQEVDFRDVDIDFSNLDGITPDQILALQNEMGSNNVDEIEVKEINESLEELNVTDNVRFGQSFFNTQPTNIAASADLPVPNDYIISLKDQLQIILTGTERNIFNLEVQLDGSILFPEIGAINVVGKSFIEVKNVLKTLVKSTYVGTEIEVSLKNLSAKKISIIGAVNMPGTYLVNPFTTITNSLAYSGGIKPYASLREILVIKPDGKTKSYDLYELLMKGDRLNDTVLGAGDTVLVKGTSKFIEINGEVIRPMIYEYKEEESLKDMLSFTLGLKGNANKDNISLTKFNKNSLAFETETVSFNDDVSLNGVARIEVFPIALNSSLDIKVLGPLKNSGYFSLDKYKLLSDLIKDLEFTDQIYPFMATLEQFDTNNFKKKELIFSLNDPTTYAQLKLYPNDKITFFSKSDYEDFNETALSDNLKTLVSEYSLRINFKGNTLSFPVFGSFSISEVIDFLGLNLDDSVQDLVSYTSPQIDLTVTGDYQDMRFQAQKFHVLTLRSISSNLINVTINGSVEYAGTYTLPESSLLTDLYELSGDFKESAFEEAIILTRESVRQNQLNALNKARDQLKEAILESNLNSRIAKDISPEMTLLLSEEISPDSLGRLAGNFSPNNDKFSNIILQDGDNLFVPKRSDTINIFGEVLYPNTLIFDRDISLKEYLNMAGGLTEFANKKEIYIIKANGFVKRMPRNIFGTSMNIVLEPGDSIVVPRDTYVADPIPLISSITSIIANLAFSAASLNAIQN